MTAPEAYLLCATPRSGSTLLCGLLRSSGVAGHPRSYFNRGGLHDYATSWNRTRPADQRLDARIDTAYVEAALAVGRTPNGVFGGRLMAESRPELLAGLAAGSANPVLSDLDLLRHAFGRLAFVHLRRVDVVAQAVSWAKSLQTHFWHPGEAIEPGGVEPHYDEELLERLVTTITRFEADWVRWFAEQHLQPYEVTYEQLSADPAATAAGVLDHLGLELPPGGRLEVRDRRQADEVNADWAARFRASRS